MKQLLSTLLSLLSMNNSTESTTSALQKARHLTAPAVVSTDGGETEGLDFWTQHAPLLRKAWHEWEQTQQGLPVLDDSVFDHSLRAAIQRAWEAPETEDAIRLLWQPVAPQVYAAQLVQPERIPDIRAYMDAAADAGIPLRRPNGMNRFGMVLDDQTEGAFTAHGMDDWLKILVNDYVRPLGRLFFREYVGAGDDSESYAFTIRYKEGEDQALREHADASLITLNLNLNVPNETDYEGSTLYFVDDETGQHHPVNFRPGMAVLHRGLTRHAAQPIVRGERTNLVVWLFGKHGYVRFVPYEEREQLTRPERWKKPKSGGNKWERIEL